MNTCGNCGATLAAGAQTCGACGAATGAPPPPPAPPTPPMPPAPAPGYGAPAGYSGPVAPKTNGMAIASLVLSLVGLLCGFTAILGVIFGFVARGQIKRTGESGDGLALAGIIVGFVIIGLGIAWFIFWVAVVASSDSTYNGVIAPLLGGG